MTTSEQTNLTTEHDVDWGPLAEPVHAGAAGPGGPPWKDNAYLSFWDYAAGLYGAVHVSTSPNGEGRRARCSVSVAGRPIEIVEELAPGTFTSASIDYGLTGRIRVSHPDVEVDLMTTPRFGPADYGSGDVLPALVEGKPLQHYQQGAEVIGTVTVAGTVHELRGTGLRDRTWGFRDEAAQWVEYAGLIASFTDFDVTVMTFLGADGAVRTDGFLQDAAGATRISGLKLTRDPAALFVRGRMTLADGTERVVTAVGREGGFWVPMGAEREGPAFGAYDDFLRLDAEGTPGSGLVEQGILHRVG